MCATTTTNLGLRKPATTDTVNVALDIAGNMDTIDTAVAAKAATADVVTKALVDAKGDIIVASAADTVARLAVGTNDQVLPADSAQASGLKWATPSSGTSVLPHVHVRRAAVQSITAAAYNLITFDTEVEDTDTMYTAGSADRITIKTAGIFHLEGAVELAASTSGALFVVALHTSATPGTGQIAASRGGTFSADSIILQASRDYRFAVNDIVTLQVYQATGASRNTVAGVQSMFLTAQKVRD